MAINLKLKIKIQFQKATRCKAEAAPSEDGHYWRNNKYSFFKKKKIALDDLSMH